MSNSEYLASPQLLALKEKLDQREQCTLSPLATFSRDARRRRPEKKSGHRLPFALDADRILHSRAYTRYIDKTQVFYLVRNDHITHRVLHVQLVSKIARTVGRFLGLNEDLIEAIALGHDIGHPPFGHDGEKELARLCRAHGLPGYQHNIQSVRFLDRIEKKGQGWNLTIQTLDGILCHDGEIHDQALQPCRRKDFSILDRELAAKAERPELALVPMSLEGCVVRFSDTIGYIGRDIEDAIELKLIGRSDIPASCRRILGDTNGKIVYRLVEDLITNSLAAPTSGSDPDTGMVPGEAIGFSREISESLQELKRFNYERIYMNPRIKLGLDAIRSCYQALFETYLEQINGNRRDSAIFTEFLNSMEPSYLEADMPAAMVRDFMAGMTDNYFLEQAALIGCQVPLQS